MGPTISTKSHDTKSSSSHYCVLLTNRNQTREENNSVGAGSRETKSKPAVILELQWFWPKGQMEILSKFQLQVKLELNLYLYSLLHVQPTASGIHTPACAPASRNTWEAAFRTGDSGVKNLSPMSLHQSGIIQAELTQLRVNPNIGIFAD